MIVFFDIDGTLITEDSRHFLPESTVRAIHQMQKNGHLAVINTGRTRFNVIYQPYVTRIGFDGFVCACGTHIILDGKDRLSVTVPSELVPKIVRASERYGMRLMMEGPEHFYFGESAKETELGKDILTRCPELCRNASDPDALINKFVTFDSPGCDRESFTAAVSSDFDAIDRGGGFMEYCRKGYSKATGIDEMLRLTGLTLKDCIAVGDSANDLPMLKYVPHSVLMGNGLASLRPEVEYVTADLLDDGIEKALRHYGLIQKQVR